MKTTRRADRRLGAAIIWMTAAACSTGTSSYAQEMRATGTSESELAAVREEAERIEEDAVERLFEARGRVRRLMQGDAQTARDATEGKIVNGVLTHAYPSAGSLLVGTADDNMESWCSGTMVGCSTFVTARHCVDSRINPGTAAVPSEYDRFRIFLQHGGMFRVSNIATRSDYAFPHADVAVITLQRPINGITTTPLNSTLVEHGTAGRIVGFGGSGGMREDYGLKRLGRIVTAACADGEPSSLLCWDYDGGEAESNTCNADSGGPLFVAHPEASVPTPVLAGITSGGTRADCLKTDHSYDVDVRQFSEWIQSVTKDKLGAVSCGTLPQWGTAKVKAHEHSGKLNAGKTSASTYVDVPEGAQLLRVAMNAEDTRGAIDFDLFIREGAPPVPGGTADCARTVPSQYGFCEFANPAPGRWHILVTRKKGAGVFQVTSTVFRK